LAQAQINHDYAELRAPFDGIVAQIDTEAGEVAALNGRPVITVLDAANLRFEVPIAEVDIARIAVGQAAQVQLDALPNMPLAGTISYIAPSATHTGTIGTYLVRVSLDAPESVRIGMSGRISLTAIPTKK
jgi:HlyD family secretion protein